MGTIELALLHTHKNELDVELVAGVEYWLSSMRSILRKVNPKILTRLHQQRIQTLRNFTV